MRRPSSIFNSSSRDQKTTTTISPTVILDSFLLRAVMGRTDTSLAALLERAIANGYMQGTHQEEDSKRDNTKYVKKTLRDQNIALRRYEK